MKKILLFFMSAVLIFCSGCTKLSGDYESSGKYIEYLGLSNNDVSGVVSAYIDSVVSDAEYVYDDGVSEIDSIIGNIESELSRLEEAGIIEVEREESVSIADEINNSSDGEVGKQTTIVDSGITLDSVQQIEEAEINTTGTKPLYYNFLTENQKSIYRIMKTAAESMVEGMFSIGAVSSLERDRFSDITLAFKALSSDNPQIFWLPNSYITSPDGSLLAFSYHENGYNINYSVLKDDVILAKQRLDEVVNQLTNDAKKLDSRFKKELYFHDWLCQNVKYGSDGTDNSYNVYGALVNGKAVCEGYSRAMQLLCDNVGIPCTVVYGYSNGVGHMWNIVDPGDGWYHLDVTWDDDEKFDFIRHSYFNVSDSVIKIDHRIFDSILQDVSYSGSDYFNIHLYECNKNDYNFFERKNLIFSDDMANNAQIIANAIQNGQTMVELRYDCSNTNYESVFNQLNTQLSNYKAYVSQYSLMCNAISLWLTFV